MDPSNRSNWVNDSGFHQDVSNDTLDFTKPTAALLMCVLGLPGNLLVIAVYVAAMTTSTRVYMFALAVADSAICVCGIVLSVAGRNIVILGVFFCVVSLSVNFSMALLVFVSVERLLAVRRPHSFSMDPGRAMTVLGVIAGAVSIETAVSALAIYVENFPLYMILQICTIYISTLVIITCYSIVVVLLLKRIRTVRRQTGVSHVVSSTSGTMTPGVVFTPTTANETALSGGNQSTPESATKKITPAQAKTYRSMCLLFTVTVVFIGCWLPLVLGVVGVAIPTKVTRDVVVLNSVVNPFIYGVASAMFREDVRQFCRRTRAKLSTCH